VLATLFKDLKHELVYGRDVATAEEAKSAIFEHIEIFYNRQRLHSAQGWLSPMEFEERKERLHFPSESPY
jgi:putative transposase